MWAKIVIITRRRCGYYCYADDSSGETIWIARPTGSFCWAWRNHAPIIDRRGDGEELSWRGVIRMLPVMDDGFLFGRSDSS